MDYSGYLNQGFDPAGMMAAASGGGDLGQRGADNSFYGHATASDLMSASSASMAMSASHAYAARAAGYGPPGSASAAVMRSAAYSAAGTTMSHLKIILTTHYENLVGYQVTV